MITLPRYLREKLAFGSFAALATAAAVGIGIASGATNTTKMATSSKPAAAVAAVARTDSSDSAHADTSAAWQLADIHNSLVTTWIKRFTTSMRSDFSTYLDRMSKYASTVSSKIEQRGLPQELVYLPIVESGYKPTAKSPVKATGLWQFMSATARNYGLAVTSHVDERKDPAKSTDAALSYLSDLYQRFGSWYLAAAAYNAGPGAVERALERVTGKKSGTDADYYRIASALPKETRDYVPKLIAAATIAKDPAKYGFDSTAANAD